MGQPKRKQSKRRSALRRGANQYKAPTLAKAKDGSACLSHRVNPVTGEYRGRKVIEVE